MRIALWQNYQAHKHCRLWRAAQSPPNPCKNSCREGGKCQLQERSTTGEPAVASRFMCRYSWMHICCMCFTQVYLSFYEVSLIAVVLRAVCKTLNKDCAVMSSDIEGSSPHSPASSAQACNPQAQPCSLVLA